LAGAIKGMKILLTSNCGVSYPQEIFFPFNKRKQNMYKGVSWAGGPLKGKRKETSRGAIKPITKEMHI